MVDHPLARLRAGGYSLPLTYWGWAAGGTLVWRLILALMNATIAPTAALAWYAAVLTLLAFIAYLAITAVAVWRSAGLYKGPRVWAMLARVAVVVQIGFLALWIVGRFLPQPL
jgi:hypothetical protein